ncbi:MAG: hypothetical protein IK093_07160 [Ruminiclostridium sp.]|nr:hypothetical protein [Ruminiclostridium sp.]
MNENLLHYKKSGGAEQYLKPEMEVIEMSGEDVIVTSCSPNTCPGGDDFPGPPPWSGEVG